MNRREFLGTSLSTPLAMAQVQALQKPRAVAGSGVWTLENGRITRVLAASPPGGLLLRELRNARTGFNWAAGDPTDIFLSAGPDRVSGFGPDSGFRVDAHESKTRDDGAAELKLTLFSPARGVKITLLQTCFPGVAVIEHRAWVENAGSKPIPAVSRFDPLFVALRTDQGPLFTHWIQGMAEYPTTNEQDGPRLYPAHLHRREELGAGLELTGGKRSSEKDVGWLCLENTRHGEFLFAAVEWAGEWGLRLVRQGRHVLLTGGVLGSSRTLNPGQSVESPRVFVGLASGELDDAVHELHDYLKAFLLPKPSADNPWVAYNIWPGYEPPDVEAEHTRELEIAASIGCEMMSFDATWYEGSPEPPGTNFSLGLGTWVPSRKKFPRGMEAWSAQVHRKGLKFGVWVEPERVDLNYVPAKVPREWLATRNGVPLLARYENGKWAGVGQVCLGSPAAVDWAKHWMADLVERYQMDWLKIDHNGFDICNNPDHGHQAGDGNYAHVRGLYDVWAHLLRKYPHLVTENCAGGAHRIDFGLARYMHRHWMHDQSYPSHRARHQVIGQSYLFPGSQQYPGFYYDLEPVDRPSAPRSQANVDSLFRSRMANAFMISTHGRVPNRLTRWKPEHIEAARRNIANFKTYRHLLRDDVYHLLPQAHMYLPDGRPSLEWDAIEFAKRDSSEAIVLVFRGIGAQETYRVQPKGLAAGARYSVTSLNSGKSAALGAKGVEVNLPEAETSEILHIRKAGS
jgi:alpha-galactosidase